MAIIYECDRCTHHNTDPTDFYVVRIACTQQQVSGYSHPMSASPQRLWCESCTKEAGLKWVRTVNVPEPPTFEDMIREIVQDEIQNSQ